MTNIFYFKSISEIGGIETFLYYLSKLYKNYDVTIIYDYANREQLARLKKNVKCIKFNGQEIECEKAFFNYNLDIIDKVKAKEYYQIIHGDYKATGIQCNTNTKITKYLAVSKIAGESFYQETGIKPEIIYNPLNIDKPKKILKLISATRLTNEKGYNRMIKLAKELSDKKIPFEWHVFTNKSDIDSDFFIARKPKLNIINDIAEADYLVQLSDSEGYCYSIVEALSVGTPVICTNIPVLKEIGVSKNNSYILNLDMFNINVDKIYKEIPKVTNYKAPECLLINYIDKIKSKYEEEKRMKYKVRALDTYKRMNVRDEQLNRVPEPGEEFIVSTDRLEVLSGNNSYEVKFVEVVEKIEETEQIETAVKDIKTEKAIKKTTKKKTK